MADLKLYNNGEGKILMSAGDRIIRQPYDFGRAFDITNNNASGAFANNYIKAESPIANIANGAFSVVIFKKDTVTFNNSNSVFRFTSLSFSCVIGLGAHDNTRNYFYNTQSTLTAPKAQVSTNIDKECLLTTVFSTTNFKIKENRTLVNLPVNIENSSEEYIDFIFGSAARHFSFSGDIPSLSGNELAIFDREITDGEHFYRQNNRIGSDWQSTVGMVLYWKMREAEILDFSTSQDGSDMRVGVRDFSGNNHHGQIMNLPAGTLQEQLDWANANLFVPFIS